MYFSKFLLCVGDGRETHTYDFIKLPHDMIIHSGCEESIDTLIYAIFPYLQNESQDKSLYGDRVTMVLTNSVVN